jgi:hypothetical protein
VSESFTNVNHHSVHFQHLFYIHLRILSWEASRMIHLG